MEVEPWLNSTSICSFPEPWVSDCNSYGVGSVEAATGTLTSESLSLYEGVYTNPVYPKLNITLESGKLKVK